MRFALNSNNNRVFIEEAEKWESYLCPCCERPVIVKNQGTIRTHHFAHESIIDCDDWDNDMSDWHIKWQNYFQKQYQEVVITKNGVRHRADIMVGNVVVEFQHSTISESDFYERNDFYADSGRKLIWLFDMREEFENKRIEYLDDDTCNKFKWKYAKKFLRDFDVRDKDVLIFFDLYEDDQIDGTNIYKVSWQVNEFKRFATNESISNKMFIDWINKNSK